MKFAKELEDDLVPEWRAKYINYKQGKKKIKAISKAFRNASRTPKITDRPTLSHQSSAASVPYTQYDFHARAARGKTPQGLLTESHQERANGDGGMDAQQQYANSRRLSTTKFATSPPLHPFDDEAEGSSDSGDEGDEGDEGDQDEEDEEDEERTPLKRAASRPAEDNTPTSYGSFSPPTKRNQTEGEPSANGSERIPRLPRLALPDPALDPGRQRTQSPEQIPQRQQRSQSEINHVAQAKEGERPENNKHHSVPLLKRIVQKKMAQHDQDAHKDKEPQSEPTSKPSTRDRFRKVFRSKQIDSPQMTHEQQDAYQELDQRQDEFFSFLDKEVKKIETFYRSKEDDARERLGTLRAQLHEHRDQRARDMKLEREGRFDDQHRDYAISQMLHETPLPSMPKKELEQSNGALFKNVFKNEPKVGKTSKAMNKMATPPSSPHQQPNGDVDPSRDYTRKKPPQNNETVPHRFAKRRLKLALQEFYRGLELLKSYALLNRTGFRKINKKYDKAVNARPPLRYLNEKVSEAHFVKSTLLDEYLVAVEDLYARYFERGNRKVAVSKLRSKLQEGDHSGSTFRNGLWLAAGTCLGVAGLYNGLEILFNAPLTVSTHTAYLLQMYAGYFLSLLLFLIFVLDCKIWTQARVNYVFVFEFDTRHTLDWRQLAEVPCFFLFIEGLFVWLNFEFGYDHIMYVYWPIILFGLTLLIMCLPFKVLYYHSRKWWGFSNFRLLFAGIYPVEFRDFFLGDMYTSETYAMSQIEVFFCVYRYNWQNPAQCNSNHSMLLGFFTCLPAVWRFLQCMRRYHDSGDWFPHLANGAKYTGNILYYMSLSLYRLHIGTDIAYRYRIVFIVFAIFNALYCSIWDIFMDWSLGNFFSKNVGLRNHLAFRKKWPYYAAIVFDVVLRQQWIFYAIFVEDLQHSSVVSFCVALMEVLRRGVWSLFRVENEHTNNVAKFRASRDIPLPYKIPERANQQVERLEREEGKTPRRKKTNDTPNGDASKPGKPREDSAATTGADCDLERQTTASSGSTTRRRMSNTPALRALQRVGTVIAAAHSQDFQKKRRPEVVGDTPHDDGMLQNDPASSEDEDDEENRFEIQGSVNGDNDEEDESPTGGARKMYAAQHAADADHEEDGDKSENDGGEGSSGERSPTHEAKRDAQIHNEDDIDEVRSLASSYNPDAGLRGSARGVSSKKQN